MQKYDIVVIAGGWSISQYDKQALYDRLRRVGTAGLGVNDSALFLPCRSAISMDRLWTEGRWPQLIAKYDLHNIWIRKGVVKNMELPAQVHQFAQDKTISGDPCTELTAEIGKLNGSNSGTCGVNLAYQWCHNSVGLQRAAGAWNRRVFLLGFDMRDGPNGEKHWYAPYPWRMNGATKKGTFSRWAQEYEAIGRKFAEIGVPITNVNHRSQITCLPQISFEEFCKL